MTTKFITATIITAFSASAALAEDQVTQGKELFQAQCSACHSNDAGVNGVGPSLAGLAGRQAGKLPGFDFSSALRNSHVVWDQATFDQFLKNPPGYIPGTAMAINIPSKQDRDNLYAYVETLKGAPAPKESKEQAKPIVPTITGPSQEELDQAATNPDNWLFPTQNYSGTRYVPLDQITAENAARMRAVCIYRSGEPAPMQANPIVYKGVMYLTMARRTVAIDATTCREKWHYGWEPKGHEISPTNRGAAIKDGKLVRGTADGYLIALDLGSGQLVWSKKIAGAEHNQYISAPPLAYKNLVIMGTAGADFGPKNWIAAYELETGKEVWKFNLIPDKGELGSETWENPESVKHGGGSIWTPLSLDTEKGVLYLPVGNPAPDFYGSVRPGANLYTNSVVALDVMTGKMIAYHQVVKHDVHDSDLSQVSPLFTTKIDGADRPVISVSGKDGFLRLFDRDLKKEHYAVPLTTHENFDAKPTVEGVHRCPGLLGGMEWNGPAYDPNLNTLFVPAVDWCGTFKLFSEPPKYIGQAHYYGGAVVQDPRDKAKGWLTAFDAATGKEIWKYRSETPMVAGVVATKGGVIFTGDMDNNFLALNSKNGEVLYKFNTGGSIGGGVISYRQNNKQYVATTSGSVSAFFGGSGLPVVVIFSTD